MLLFSAGLLLSDFDVNKSSTEYSITWTNETTDNIANWYSPNETTTIIEINKEHCKITNCKYQNDNFLCYSCKVEAGE